MDDCKNLPDYEILTLRIHHTPKLDFGNLQKRSCFIYSGPLQSLPKDFIDTNFAFSRTPGQPKIYVQDLLRTRAADVSALMRDPNTYFYVCGLKSMEEGVVLALQEVAQQAGLDWEVLGAALKKEGRLHLETY